MKDPACKFGWITLAIVIVLVVILPAPGAPVGGMVRGNESTYFSGLKSNTNAATLLRAITTNENLARLALTNDGRGLTGVVAAAVGPMATAEVGTLTVSNVVTFSNGAGGSLTVSNVLSVSNVTSGDLKATNAITASNATVGTLTASNILTASNLFLGTAKVTNSVTASNVTAGTITASNTLTVSNLFSGDVKATNTITASNVSSGTLIVSNALTASNAATGDLTASNTLSASNLFSGTFKATNSITTSNVTTGNLLASNVLNASNLLAGDARVTNAVVASNVTTGTLTASNTLNASNAAFGSQVVSNGLAATNPAFTGGGGYTNNWTNSIITAQQTFGTNVITAAATVYLDFTNQVYQAVTLSGNTAFHTTNRFVTNGARSMVVRIFPGGANRTLTFNTGWSNLVNLSSIVLTNGKAALLSLTLFGTNETDVWSAYAVTQ